MLVGRLFLLFRWEDMSLGSSDGSKQDEVGIAVDIGTYVVWGFRYVGYPWVTSPFIFPSFIPPFFLLLWHRYLANHVNKANEINQGQVEFLSFIA